MSGIRLRTTSVFLCLSFAATPAAAEVCDKVRPFWTPGTEATAWTEFLGLIATPPSLVLIVITAHVLRFRSQWGGVAVVVLWTIWVSLVVFVGADDEVQKQALAEGCIGPPTLFIGAIAAICGVTILLTAPRVSRPNSERPD